MEAPPCKTHWQINVNFYLCVWNLEILNNFCAIIHPCHFCVLNWGLIYQDVIMRAIKSTALENISLIDLERINSRGPSMQNVEAKQFPLPPVCLYHVKSKKLGKEGERQYHSLIHFKQWHYSNPKHFVLFLIPDAELSWPRKIFFEVSNMIDKNPLFIEGGGSLLHD